MSRVKLIIDNRPIEVRQGDTILAAAEKLGIRIPTMCFLKGYSPSASCMVCVVKVSGRDSLVPACSALAENGMNITTDSDEVLSARTAAMEFLLSDHLGDCMGPCHVTCPAKMNIPLMIRQIESGDLPAAIKTIKKDIALPAVLGRICPAPCEKTCRRADYDKPVSICLLKRYTADVDLQSAAPYMPDCAPDTGKKVAIIGAGPAGLSAAFYLRQCGHKCIIFDEHQKPGGMLRFGVERIRLPEDILDAETGLILRPGVGFRGNMRIGRDISMSLLRKDFDAVFIAAGKTEQNITEIFGTEHSDSGIKINSDTYQTTIAGVFAGGDITGERRLAVRAGAHGREAAVSIHQYLSGRPVTGASKKFNTRIGRLSETEMKLFLAEANAGDRQNPAQINEGLTARQAVAESARCLGCDCRKADDCLLRTYSEEYGAKAGRYKEQRREFIQYRCGDIVYEPGKCIKCGLCIQAAARAGEKLGLAFAGRGFGVSVAAPFNKPICDGLEKSAANCAKVCPVGAFAFADRLRTE